ncbi:MAG TPA: right-handed parallel beta-helix repeat-containing protein, partial [Polyangiaceae bacterium]|nr:right-handed parallel beta-helix repeat-containing protein [Polyangiaceae bacterium]
PGPSGSSTSSPAATSGGAGLAGVAGTGSAGGSAGSGGGGSESGAGNTGGSAGSGGSSPELPEIEACNFPHSRAVVAGNPAELALALAGATPGTLIRLADGSYDAAWSAKTSGTAEAPIVLCGTRDAVLEATPDRPVFSLQASYWILSGFTLTGGQKGLLLDGAGHNLLTGLSVHDIGHEAVHLRTHSSDNVLERCEIYETGQANAGFGEGVYIGSAQNNWASISAGGPDRSDRNVIEANLIGPNVRAESIDIKEGTSAGIVRGNTLDGAGMSGAGYADSWLDVKGNGYLIEDNQARNALLDGFQIHVEVDGWGNDNVFYRNALEVNGPGYGFQVFGGASGTIIGCDNQVSGADEGFANVDCEP